MRAESAVSTQLTSNPFLSNEYKLTGWLTQPILGMMTPRKTFEIKTLIVTKLKINRNSEKELGN